MLLPLPFQNPAVRAPAPPTYASAESTYLDFLDQSRKAPAPSLAGEDRLAYRWLEAAGEWTTGPLPADGFPAGSRPHREALALRRLLALPSPKSAAVAKIHLTLGGSKLLLWRWMKAREREAHLPVDLRHAVEDRLLEPGPAILRGWALRHALCFALAERDLKRFATLHRTSGSEGKYILRGFQALFALLDGPSPIFRLWRLPEMDYMDLSFGGLGASQVWVAPLDMPPGKSGVAWILPSATGEFGDREARLSGKVEAEAKDLSDKLRTEGLRAWFAPSANEWEEQGLTFFPILMELDGKGVITSIYMGDAAPARP